jgi:peptide/nickel transport system substrate-binding protein
MNMLKSMALMGLMVSILLLTVLPLASAEGKTIRIALGEEPESLNPIDNANIYECNKIFSGLLRSDDKMQMVPDLAESWEESPDGLTYTFHLHQGAKWQDGTDLTADDVKFTYDLLKSQDWISIFPSSSDYEVLKDIQIVNDSTIKFTLSEDVVPFRERFTVPILPRHLLEGQDLAETDFWQSPIGTGPYKLVEWNKGEDLVMAANPDHYGGVPKIETVKFVFVPDETARVSLLKSGEVDAIKIDARTKETLEGVQGIKVESAPSANWYGLSLPNDMWPFDIKEVRQAIAYGINKQQILDAIFYGEGEVAYGPYRKADWAYNPDIEYSYDPEKSKQLLKDAGFVDSDGDGILEKDGKKLEFDLIYPSSNAERKDIAIASKSDLEKIGINLNPVGKSWDEIDYNYLHSNAFAYSWGTAFDPDDINYKLWNSQFIDQGWWNPATYSNPEVDKLLNEGRTTSDKDKRKDIYGQIQKYLVDDEPVVFIVFSNYIYAFSDKISGIEPRNGPHGYGSNGALTGELWWNIDKWDVKE